MSVSPERIEEALARAETDRNEYGQAYWHSDAVVLAAALREAQAENERLREAVENLYDDVDELLAQNLRLHDLQQQVGAVFLGSGGGFNHVEDLRAALAPADEAKP